MSRVPFVLPLFFALVATAPLQGQGRGNGAQNRTIPDAAQARDRIGVPSTQSRDHRDDARDRGIPPGHMPPPGMCRIWIDGVPPGRQPRPTDCATARRNRPHNARIIYGRDARYDDRDRNECTSIYDPRCDDDDRRRGGDDDRRRGDDWCRDANHDGRCDYRNDDRNIGYPRDLPRTLPQMIGAVMIQRGIRSPEVARWLGTQRVTARYTDADRNRSPERVTWLDGAGRVVQIWVDANRDGRADRVELFREGRRVDVIR